MAPTFSLEVVDGATMLSSFNAAPEGAPHAHLRPARCECPSPIATLELACARCGREIREPGTIGRELRRAVYRRELQWAAGEGVDRQEGFRGLHAEVGPNPPLDVLYEALSARVLELPEPETFELLPAA